MLISQVWLDLADRGLSVVDLRSDRVTLADEHSTAEYRLQVVSRPPGAARVLHAAQGAPEERTLLIAPDASPAALRAAASMNVSLLVAPSAPGQETRGSLMAPSGETIDLAAPTPVAARRGPRPWGAMAIAMYLLEGRQATQCALAVRAGVSQPRVSQVLATFGTWVERADDGWSVANSAALLRWLAAQPSPARASTTWLSLVEPAVTAAEVTARLRANGTRCAVSGDVAADILAPWARPQTARVYVSHAPDMSSLGLTPAPADRATLELVVPDDPHVLDDADPNDGQMPIVHPWRVWLDTLAGGNQAAADALRTRLLARTS